VHNHLSRRNGDYLCLLRGSSDSVGCLAGGVAVEDAIFKDVAGRGEPFAA